MGGSSDAEDIAFIGVIVAIVGVVVAFWQIDDARRFLCSEISISCERTNEVRLYVVDYKDDGPKNDGPKDDEPPPPGQVFGQTDWTPTNWDALLALKWPQDGHPSSEDPFNLLSAQIVDNKVTAGNKKWDFASVKDGRFELSKSKTLVFDLQTRYDFPLQREVTINVNIHVKNGTLQIPSLKTTYRFVQRKGSQYFREICPLPLANNLQFVQFEFNIIDDFFHADKPFFANVEMLPGSQ